MPPVPPVPPVPPDAAATAAQELDGDSTQLRSWTVIVSSSDGDSIQLRSWTVIAQELDGDSTLLPLCIMDAMHSRPLRSWSATCAAAAAAAACHNCMRTLNFTLLTKKPQTSESLARLASANRRYQIARDMCAHGGRQAGTASQALHLEEAITWLCNVRLKSAVGGHLHGESI